MVNTMPILAQTIGIGINMFKTIIKILPFFIVEWMARKYCSKYKLNLYTDGRPEGIREAVSPFLDTYFVIRTK